MRVVHIKTVLTLDDSERSAVYRWLRDHNVEKNRSFVDAMERGVLEPLAIIARDDSGAVSGGLIAETVLDWLRVHVIAVRPESRSMGIGTRLMGAAEQAAKARHCIWAYIDTMSYQSPEFYRRLGYTEVGQIPDWDSHGHSKYFFTKRL